MKPCTQDQRCHRSVPARLGKKFMGIVLLAARHAGRARDAFARARIADPAFVGAHLEAQADASTKVVRKVDPAEKVDLFGPRKADALRLRGLLFRWILGDPGVEEREGMIVPRTFELGGSSTALRLP